LPRPTPPTDTTGSNVELRDNLAQDLCSKRGGGQSGLFCGGYDFVAIVCAPYGDPNQFTCVTNTTFVTPALCTGFSN
jgi:hypothetical protein